MPMPLERYHRVNATNIHSLKDELCRSMMKMDMHLVNRDVPVDAQINQVRVGSLDFKCARVGPPVQVNCNTITGSYIIHMPLSGSTAFEIEGNQFETNQHTGAIMSPGMKISANWEINCASVLMMIGQNALQDHLSQMMGYEIDEPLIFSSEFDLASEDGTAWSRLWQYVMGELDQTKFYTGNTARTKDTSSLVMTTLLTAASSNYSDRLREHFNDASGLPSSLRIAKEYIETHAADRPSVSEIAEHSGVSERQLNKLFSRYLGMSPQKLVLIVRLRGARSDLERLGAKTTVTETATDWGFFALSRFADQYRNQFGELPSDTITRVTKVSPLLLS